MACACSCERIGEWARGRERSQRLGARCSHSQAKEAFGKKPTMFNRVTYLYHRCLRNVLMPIALAGILINILSLMLAALLALYMWQFYPIWLLLVCIVAIHNPFDWIADHIGAVDPPVDLDGYDHWFEKRVLIASEGKVFKFYFTAYLKVAGIVFQLFVTRLMMNTVGTLAWQHDLGHRKAPRECRWARVHAVTGGHRRPCQPDL